MVGDAESEVSVKHEDRAKKARGCHCVNDCESHEPPRKKPGEDEVTCLRLLSSLGG